MCVTFLTSGTSVTFLKMTEGVSIETLDALDQSAFWSKLFPRKNAEGSVIASP